jgi:hypothetical protein
MTRRLSFSIAVLVALIALYVVVLRVAPAPDRSKARNAPPASPVEGGAAFEKPGPYPTEYDEVTVRIEIPPLSEFPALWAESDGCPHSRMTKVLGAGIGPGNGCPVLTVEPDGPADKAGIKRFDRLGEPSDCPSTLYRSFRPGKEACTVEWMVRRPKGGTAESPGADAPATESEEGGV